MWVHCEQTVRHQAFGGGGDRVLVHCEQTVRHQALGTLPAQYLNSGLDTLWWYAMYSTKPVRKKNTVTANPPCVSQVSEDE